MKSIDRTGLPLVLGLLLLSFPLIALVYSLVGYSLVSSGTYTPDIAVTFESGPAGDSEIGVNGTTSNVTVVSNLEDYVDNDLSDVDGSADKGTHLNFAAQQSGPDSVYDTLTEAETNITQVTFVAAGTGSGTTGNPTPAYPPSLQANDLILLQVTVRDTTNTPTTPTGFTLLYGPDSTGTGRQWIYYRISDGTESGTITITINGTACKIGRMYAFRNVATSNFAEGGGFGAATGFTISAQSVTTTGLKRLAVAFVLVNDDNTVGSFSGEDGGNWIEAVAEFTTFAGSDGCVQLQTATMPSDGTISGGSYTMFASDPWGVRAFALIPAATPNYELDLEVQWTNVEYNLPNEQLSIYAYRGNNTNSLDATGGYMIVGDGTPNWGSTRGTISFWVKWDVRANRPWGQHDNMETRISGSSLVVDWGTFDSIISATSFTANKWYFIAIVWNEDTDDLYLYVGDQGNLPTLDTYNGNWQDTVSDEGVTQNNFMASKNGVQPMDGHGDDLRYWNIDRTLAQIQSDYDRELTGSETNLRSYFKLNGNFDDIGPNNSDGSGSGSYSFSADVPFDPPATENIRVDVWTVSGWQNLFANLANGWNNISVSSYLNSSTFTIRFKGSSESGDAAWDSLKIDATLLHVWSGGSTFDYVLAAVSQKTYDQNTRLVLYGSSNIGRLSNLTVWFRDGTTSIQIQIIGGSIVSSSGNWYSLPASSQRYIVVYADASAAGTSTLYIRLEAVRGSSIIYTCLIRLTVN